MVALEQVLDPDYKFPSGIDAAVAALTVRVEAIARRHGLTVETWEEDGLGMASGFGLKLATGRVVLFTELAHMIKHFGALGPLVYADAGDMVESGPESIVDEVLAAIGLDRGDVGWIATEEDRHSIAEHLERWRSPGLDRRFRAPTDDNQPT